MSKSSSPESESAKEELVEPPRLDTFSASASKELKDHIAALGHLLKRLAPQIFGSAYLIWWDKKFAVRQRLGKWAGVLLLFLAAVEITGPMFHWLFLDGLPRHTQLFVSVGLVACAVIVISHHHRLEKRLQRHRVLVDAVRCLAADIAKRPTFHTLEDVTRFIEDALQSLVFVVQQGNHEKPTACAALLLMPPEADHFTILEQCPKGWHNRELKIDGKESAAARVLNYEAEETLYIPWTRFRNGAKILTIQKDAESHTKHFRTKSEANAMQILGGKEAPDLLPAKLSGARRSLMCSRVPTQNVSPSEKPLKGTAVLCLETNKRACLGELDFHAIKVIGVLIGHVLDQHCRP